jgi:hypothetical protein
MRSLFGWLGIIAFAGLLGTGTASAGQISCPNDPSACGVIISANDEVVAAGQFVIDEDGSVRLADVVAYQDPRGFGASIDTLGGNVDPELVFGLGATNTSNAPVNFSFIFSLPIGSVSPPLSTEAVLGTSLTASSGAAATIAPTLGVGKIVDSQDIRLSPFQSVDKGVDIGDAFAAAAGTTATRIETAFGSILSGGPFNLMVVTIAFALSDADPGTAGAGVGFSGRVTQIETPTPSAGLMLGLGLLALARARSLSTR